MKVKKHLKVNSVEATLPKTRKQLFFRLLKEDFYLIIDLSLVEALFSLPLIATLVFEYVFLTGVSVKVENVFPIVFYTGLISCVGWAIKYVGRCACFSVMKKRVHNEGCFITSEVIRSIKTSGVKSAFNGLIAGFSAFIAQVGSVYLIMVSTTPLKWFAVGALALQFVLVFGAAEYFTASENFYELSFGVQWKNSFFFSAMTFPLTFVHFSLTIALPFAVTIFSPWAAIVAAAVYSITGNGLSVLAATLVAHGVFDKFINQEHYPEYVGKGLSKDKEV